MTSRYSMIAEAIWPILAEVSDRRTVNGRHRQGTITYGLLCDKISDLGVIPRALTGPLTLIATYCKRHDLPALNVIVVKKQDGRPGVAVKLSKAGTASDEIDLVHALDWANIHAPSAQELSLSETATS